MDLGLAHRSCAGHLGERRPPRSWPPERRLPPLARLCNSQSTTSSRRMRQGRTDDRDEEKATRWRPRKHMPATPPIDSFHLAWNGRTSSASFRRTAITVTYRSRNHVMGLAALASDDDSAVNHGSTRRPRAKALPPRRFLVRGRRMGIRPSCCLERARRWWRRIWWIERDRWRWNVSQQELERWGLYAIGRCWA
jgi:hypothetical protein